MNMKVLKYLALVSQIGIIMALPLFGSVFLGHWIDEKAGTNGIFLIIFILMGIYVSFRNMFVMILKKTDEGKKDNH
jgi:ATP synthase protein I